MIENLLPSQEKFRWYRDLKIALNRGDFFIAQKGGEMERKNQLSFDERITILEEQPYTPLVGLRADSLGREIRESDLPEEEQRLLIIRLNAIANSKGRGGIEFF